MSAFVGTASTAPATIENDGFWPDIDAANLRAAMRVGDVSAARMQSATVSAILSVNQELDGLKARYQAQGHATLADVPAPSIAGHSRLLHLYTRAVHCTCAAEIAERYRTYSATGAGGAKADDEEQSADDYRRDARFALRDLLGTARATVVLL